MKDKSGRLMVIRLKELSLSIFSISKDFKLEILSLLFPQYNNQATSKLSALKGFL